MDKIICLGKNYLDHARELGDAVPDKPVLFLKPPSVLRAARRDGELMDLRLPTEVGEIHHECEIVIRLSRGGYRVSEAEASSMIGGVTLGLDMTLRDRQAVQKKNGHPWTTSKVFIDSAVVGPWCEGGQIDSQLSQPFSFLVDGTIRQQGKAEMMTYSPARSIAYASEFFPLVEGDLVFTGTPVGVGAIRPGNVGTLKWGTVLYSVRWRGEESA